MKKFLLGFAVTIPATMAMAATDIEGVITDVTAYKTSAIALGILILVYLIGRKVVKRLI